MQTLSDEHIDEYESDIDLESDKPCVVIDETTDALTPKPYEPLNFSWGSPEEAFEKKIMHLMDLLDCSESEATHIILHHL